MLEKLKGYWIVQATSWMESWIMDRYEHFYTNIDLELVLSRTISIAVLLNDPGTSLTCPKTIGITHLTTIRRYPSHLPLCPNQIQLLAETSALRYLQNPNVIMTSNVS